MGKKTDQQIIINAANFFESEDVVQFAYLFGSKVEEGRSGPLSDFDFAVYLKDHVDFLNTRLRLMGALAQKIQTERFDLIILNEAPLVFCYQVIQNFVILKEDKQLRIIFEERVLRSYLDTIPLRATHYKYLKESLLEKVVHG
ncbi:MAG: nucleotidyltransferase domain-containing protein [Proteobacteria bacterium]|nr:nucleotidyltransferase domain-containing protein [Pseudomonadota bacterium]